MTKLYKSKVATEPHIISAYKLRDFLSPRESINETGKSYGYVCQRQKKHLPSLYGLVNVDDINFDSFIMSEDVFNDAYEEIR